MENGLSLVVDNLHDFTLNNLRFAQLIAANHFQSGHFRNPFMKNSALYDEYQRAAMALLKGNNI